MSFRNRSFDDDDDLEVDSPSCIGHSYSSPYRTPINHSAARRAPILPDSRMDSGFVNGQESSLPNSLETILDESLSNLNLDDASQDSSQDTVNSLDSRRQKISDTTAPEPGEDVTETNICSEETSAEKRAHYQDCRDESYESMKDENTPAVSKEDDRLTELLNGCENTLRSGSRRILTSLARKDSEHNTVLHWTIVFGWVRDSLAIIRLVPYMWYLETKNDLGQTPLFLALYMRQISVVQALVKAGVSLTDVDRHGNSCFHVLARTGDLDSLIALAKGVTTDVKTAMNRLNNAGLSAAHIAVQESHIHVLEHLRRIGADLNKKDGCSGFTPLHHAICCYGDGNTNLVKYLVKQAKVDLTAKDFYKRTPLMLAYGYRCVEVSYNLVVHGRRQDQEWLSCPPYSEYKSYSGSSDSDSDDEDDLSR